MGIEANEEVREGGRNSMTATTREVSLAKRKLLLHDGAAFLVLMLVAVTLFGVTLFLFRSFEEHRAELAVRWSDRGMAALREGKAQAAIEPLRTALSYAPDNHEDALLLAQALGDAGHTEEATNYFLNLWETKPGDGFINLELARLLRSKGDPAAAVNYYRAAIFGTWQGDGVVRRRDVRLELARYLVEQKDLRSAQTELQIAEGNAPDNAGLDEIFGDRFVEAGDSVDALSSFKKAIKDGPHNRTALLKAGRLAYDLGQYVEARGLLARAIRESSGARHGEGAQVVELDALYDKVDRLVDLAPFRSLSEGEQMTRLLEARLIAGRRMNACMAGPGTAGGVISPALVDLRTQWAGAPGRISREALLRDESQRDAVRRLVSDTEVQTASLCGQPSGDDAVLLRLIQVPPAREGLGAEQEGR